MTAHRIPLHFFDTRRTKRAHALSLPRRGERVRKGCLSARIRRNAFDERAHASFGHATQPLVEALHTWYIVLIDHAEKRSQQHEHRRWKWRPQGMLHTLCLPTRAAAVLGLGAVLARPGRPSSSSQLLPGALDVCTHALLWQGLNIDPNKGGNRYKVHASTAFATPR